VTLPAAVLTAWSAGVANASVAGLPNATGTVDVDATGTVARITVQWLAPQAAAGQENRYITDVVIPAPPAGGGAAP
jgi:hypothetical protein